MWLAAAAAGGNGRLQDVDFIVVFVVFIFAGTTAAETAVEAAAAAAGVLKFWTITISILLLLPLFAVLLFQFLPLLFS